ncbi:hypothetical protein EMIHUDRAFT_354579 [Emiliania huxleyi CCMP1516]|uniref:Uncharacterized protein n=2 Tax=Emiliania huxleyi TaxID=2903 RepID=A0A0D3JKG1_EMIH1|nr:hypothetical protein EMIHUDRAFT_354579 [Emiliania huxleyi CCMP1516]EOD23996.1 hypothetical protein EMIHUDRAFT_354579 [Emiliania huxleyi CCMP1516]|eukprot:XP_005776425.1 hypothetical protein EMIHUDRAFT_354579 [Emiliania huxleyi CCMP1516]
MAHMESGASGCQEGALHPLASMYEVARNAACRLVDWKKTLGPKQPGESARSPRLTAGGMKQDRLRTKCHVTQT